MNGATRAVLFYDDACGPCTLFARASRALARREVEILPLRGTEPDRILGRLTPERRYGSFHLSIHGRLDSGPDALP